MQRDRINGRVMNGARSLSHNITRNEMQNRAGKEIFNLASLTDTWRLYIRAGHVKLNSKQGNEDSEHFTWADREIDTAAGIINRGRSN